MKLRVPVLVVTFAITVSVAHAWPGPPASPPPRAPGLRAPPPAWIETQTKCAWLAYGDYCWKRVCVDMSPLQRRHGLPRFSVRRGKTVRAHLGFAPRPKSIEVTLYRSIGLNVQRTEIRATLKARGRIVSWNALRSGILALSAHAVGRTGGGASYVARLLVG